MARNNRRPCRRAIVGRQCLGGRGLWPLRQGGRHQLRAGELLSRPVRPDRKTGSTAVVVDLSSCTSRGVVEPLPSPGKAQVEPDVQFIVSRTQLDCLKKKLETPGIVLDPSATIELDSCG
ncbi:hypothetical protein NKJ74_22385 [Mesorhizobium sp. M0046]|uniref:hypothetical protein n=1 Tax=Mesorhizobium sp. M0046 TaxID=2956858 RepID=UPI00333E01F6